MIYLQNQLRVDFGMVLMMTLVDMVGKLRTEKQRQVVLVHQQHIMEVIMLIVKQVVVDLIKRLF